MEEILKEVQKETPDFEYETINCMWHQNYEKCDKIGYDNPLNLFPAKLYIQHGEISENPYYYEFTSPFEKDYI